MTWSRWLPRRDRSRPVPSASGRLRVGARVGTHGGSGEAMFQCLCDPDLGGCGARPVVVGSALRSGRTRSCGCLAAEATAETNRRRALARADEVVDECCYFLDDDLPG